MNHPKSTLSNTIGIEAELVDRGADAALARAFCMEIGRIPEDKLRDGVYVLLDESMLEQEPLHATEDRETGRRLTHKEIITRGFSGIAGPDARIDFHGVDDLCGHRDSRDEQLMLYRMLNRRPLSEILGLATGRKRDKTKRPEEDGDFLFRREINRALGTNKLRDILDITFGNAFSKIIKENIADLWFCYGKALVAAGSERDAAVRAKAIKQVEAYARFCPTLRWALPVGQHARDPNRWIFFILRNNAKRLG